MIRLPSTQCDVGITDTLLSPLVIVWTGAVIVIVWLATLLVSSSALSALSTRSDASLVSVAKWVNETGDRTVIRGVVLHALGFAEADIAVRERGFRVVGQQLTHVCAVSAERGFEDTVFLSSVDETNGDATVWRSTREGRLNSTAQFIDGIAKKIPNDEAQRAFVTEKAYFIKQMNARPSRNDLPPSASVLGSAGPVELEQQGQNQGRRQSSKLRSEIMGVPWNSWVMPVIILIFSIGAQWVARTR